jgi:hypothetical protein
MRAGVGKNEIQEGFGDGAARANNRRRSVNQTTTHRNVGSDAQGAAVTENRKIPLVLHCRWNAFGDRFHIASNQYRLLRTIEMNFIAHTSNHLRDVPRDFPLPLMTISLTEAGPVRPRAISACLT